MVMLFFGWLFFCIALIGVVIPVLPTTPFLLLTAALFARSSEKCEKLLKSTKVYKRYVVPFKQDGGISRKKKCEILLIVYVVLFISAILVSQIHTTLLLITVAAVLTFFIVRIPTARKVI